MTLLSADDTVTGVDEDTSETPDPPEETVQLSAQSEQATVEFSPTFYQTIFSWRAVMALHMHLLLVLTNMLGQNMPFALVCMADKAPSSHNASKAGPEMTSPLHHSSTGWPDVTSDPNASFVFSEEADSMSEYDGKYNESRAEFEWESSLQGLVLSATPMLAFVAPLLVDFFSRKLGCKRLTLWVVLTGASLTLLQPVGVRLSPYVLVALRMGIGFVGVMPVPLASEIFSWWAPNSEKVTMLSFAFSGAHSGAILASITAGLLCSIPVDHGWPFIFYVHGVLAALWCLAWQLTGNARPEDHPAISEDEKLYIIRTRHAMSRSQKRTSPPYRKILTSVPVWSCAIVAMAYLYCTNALALCIPLYFKNMLGFSVLEVGLISSVGFVAKFLGTVAWGQVLSFLMKRTRLSTTASHKLVQSGSFYLSAVFLVALGFLRERVSAIVLVFLVMLGQSSASASAIAVPLEMAPRYAGFLNGLMMTIGMVAGFSGPLLSSLIIQNGTVEEWRNVFISQAAVSALGATCFLTMASARLQRWAAPEQERQLRQLPE